MTPEQADFIVNGIKYLVYIAECCLFVLSVHAGYILGRAR